MLTVHLRINDHGRPVPCRVRLDAADEPRLPLGRSVNDPQLVLALDDAPSVVTDGTCEVRLPPGPVRIRASRGPFYPLLDQTQSLTAGKLALRCTLDRTTDIRPLGWVSGDTRVHGLTPHGTLLQAAAEDLQFVQLLLREGESLAAFSGDQPCLWNVHTTLAVNTLNGDPVRGYVALLNAHRPVFPLDAEGWTWTVEDWCDQCHRKKGLVVWPDLPRLTEGDPGGEALAALVTKRIDAIEVTSKESLEVYHRLLNAGLRAGLVGASGRDHATVSLGRVRTYASIEGEPNLPSWIEALRGGRTVASSGPLLKFTAIPGPRWLLRAEAIPGGEVEILINGQPVAAGRDCVETEVALDRTSWLAARCDGLHGWAHTSAVWADLPDRPYQRRVHPSLLSALDETAKRIPSPDARLHLNDARRFLTSGDAP